MSKLDNFRNLKMETFEKSAHNRQSQPSTRDDRFPKLKTWIASGLFEKENEHHLVDLPDHLSDGHYLEDFAKDMCQRYNKYGSEMFMSEKQVNLLNQIIARYCA